MKKLFLILTLFLASNNLYATNQFNEENIFSTRKMYSLQPEYRNANQLLTIKRLSSVLEYAGRSILVVQLIDNSEVPFYRSTGINSGLPETWLPFFGLRNDGWLHKNYTFDEDHDTHIPLNPLYHSGDYILAQVGNELDRLTISRGDVIPNNIPGIVTINYWIGGQMLDPTKMSQALKLRLKRELTSPVEDKYIQDQDTEVVNVASTFSQNRFQSFRIRSEERQFVTECGKYFAPYVKNDELKNKYFVNEMGKAPKFIHDLMTLTSRMGKLVNEQKNQYRDDYEAFITLIKQSFALYHPTEHSSDFENKLNAYLALQMLKRFSFNYVYMMLHDIAKETPSLKLTEDVSSRAVWIAIKQTKKFNDRKKSKQIKQKLLDIKNKKLPYFQTLCTEHPVQIMRFISDRPTVDTETEMDFNNGELLENIRVIISQIYENPAKEIFNIKRVIQRGYHSKDFYQMVAYYSQLNHLFGELFLEIESHTSEISSKLTTTIEDIKSKNFKEALIKVQNVETKLQAIVKIPQTLEKLQKVDLTQTENYEIVLKDLLHLKNIFQFSDLDNKLKSSAQLSIEQLTTVLYMDAIARISRFQ